MTSTTDTDGTPVKSTPRWLRAMKSLRDRRMAAMLMLSLAAGLPYGAVLGTLNAWFTSVDISPRTIGAFSIVTLVYAFKFLWAPVFQNAKNPVPNSLGPRRAWLILFQVGLAGLLLLIGLSNPVSEIGLVAVLALLAAGFSATHDIILDAWRIEVAESDEDKDLMSALYQFGHRFAGLLTGAGALFAASRFGWQTTYLCIAGLMALSILGSFIAPEPAESKNQDKDRPSFLSVVSGKLKLISTGIIGGAWVIVVVLLTIFVSKALTESPPPRGSTFVREQGPLIIFLGVIFPAIIAAFLLFVGQKDKEPTTLSSDRSGIVDILFRSVLDPFMDLISRLKWSAILVLALVLTYRFTDLVWGAFAYPFYLGTNYGALGHTMDEIAIASKTFGVIMTIAGSAIGAGALVFLGRLPCLVVGGILAAATNLLFADLAIGGGGLDLFLSTTRLDLAFSSIGFDDRMARLMTAIAGENLAVGFASVAIVAYLTSIVNPKFAAVQYALLASLGMLIGTLGRPWLGEIIEKQGFYDVFIITAILGAVAVVFAVLEWIRLGVQKPVLQDVEA